MALAHPIHPKSVFAMELRAERAKGKAEESAKTEQKIALEKSITVQNMLAKNYSWSEITEINGVTEADFPALFKKAEGANNLRQKGMKGKRPAFLGDDSLLRLTFSDTKQVVGLIREFLPEKLVANLDLAQLKHIPEKIKGKQLKERRDDLNFECPLIPKGKVSIRILVEHKTDHDPNLWLQLCANILHTWTNSKMAPVIPIVLHTGPKHFRYNSPQYELRWAPQSIREWLPTIPIVAIDLSGNSETRIENSPHLDAVAKVILCIMKLVQSKNASLHKTLNIIHKNFPSPPSEIQREHLETAIAYLKHKTGMPSVELDQLRSKMALAHPIHPRSVFAMELRNERAMGIAIGIAQAEQKAALEKSTTIQHMLAEHFDWALIQKITSVAEADFPALLKKAESAGKQP